MRIASMSKQRLKDIIRDIIGLAKLYNRRDFDDVAQDVLVKLLHSRFDERYLNSRAWMFRLVKSVAYDRFRSTLREARYVDRSVCLEGDGLFREDQWIGTQTEAVTDDTAGIVETDRLQSAINALTEDKRKALLLYSEGYSYLEIADMTNTKLGTVRSRVHYARKHAQRLLA